MQQRGTRSPLRRRPCCQGASAGKALLTSKWPHSNSPRCAAARNKAGCPARLIFGGKREEEVDAGSGGWQAQAAAEPPGRREERAQRRAGGLAPICWEDARGWLPRRLAHWVEGRAMVLPWSAASDGLQEADLSCRCCVLLFCCVGV